MGKKQIRSRVVIIKTRLCIDCGTRFPIKPTEILKLKEKKVPLPTRCGACRKTKLILNKIKRLTKVVHQIYGLVKVKDEPELQEKPSKRKQTPKRAGK